MPRLALLVCAAASILSAVTPLPVGALLQHPAHYFDLQHRRVLFTPRGPDAYDAAASPFDGKLDSGKPLGPPTDPKGYSWRTRLPFSFPFANGVWKEVYINLNGALTFGAPESREYPERLTWPDGTLRWLASAFDSAAAGGKPMIVPLWGLNSAEKTRISTQFSGGWFAVTWRAVRYQGPNEGYAPLGENLFQVRLSRSGVIEFRYGGIAEKDGIVGLFRGLAPAGKSLDAVNLPSSKLDPVLDLRRAEVRDDGAGLHFTMTVGGEIPGTSARPLRYQIVAVSAHEGYAMDFIVDSSHSAATTYCFLTDEQNHPVGTDCAGIAFARPGPRSVELYLPKIDLKDPAHVDWKAGTSTGDFATAAAQSDEGLRPVTLSTPSASGFDLARSVAATQGSIYELFSYPFVSRSRQNAFHEIYRRAPAEADLAIAVTDFRIDDIHDHGGSNAAGPANSTELFGSPRLQSAAGPIYLGPRFGETIDVDGYHFFNYPFAVAWMAHEMIHRWVAVLNWKPPDTMALRNPTELYHWNWVLNAPAVYPVWKLFSDKPYPEPSIMGGMVAEKLPDGRSHSVFAPWGAVTGLSALDLYSMDLIGPRDVPETFFIANFKPAADGEYEGGEAVPVKIADIIEVNGPQEPPPKDAQHDFRFQVYLLHEDGRPPDPQKLAQARAIEAMVLKYFEVATGGRMKVVAQS